jgi:hypothetical protein
VWAVVLGGSRACVCVRACVHLCSCLRALRPGMLRQVAQVHSVHLEMMQSFSGGDMLEYELQPQAGGTVIWWPDAAQYSKACWSTCARACTRANQQSPLGPSMRRTSAVAFPPPPCPAPPRPVPTGAH